VHLPPDARELGTLHDVAIGNSLGFKLVIAARSMAAFPVLVNVKTAAVNDVLPTTVSGNAKLGGLIAICDTADGTPVPDIAIETLPPPVVLMVI